MRCLRVFMPFLLFLIAVPVRAQVCTGYITLSSQAEVNAFNCSKVTGSLRIEGDDITDLSPLADLTSIGDAFYISGNPVLLSLAGLESLTSVGGFLLIRGNAGLESLVGMENLASVGAHLSVRDNASLVSLLGLENVTSIGSALIVVNNDALVPWHR